VVRANRRDESDRSTSTLSQFQPTHVTFDPPPPPDYLAGAVLQGLSRPIGGKLAWGVLKSMFLALVSFGVVPLVMWTRNFRAYVVAEQQQFLHLAQWLRNHSAHPLAKRLEEDAGELRARTWMSWIAVLVVAGTAAIIAMYVDGTRRAPWDVLFFGTYGHDQANVLRNRGWWMPRANEIFITWCVGMGAAYFLHWLQVQLHAGDVRRFVERFSEIAQAEGVNRVRAEPLGLGLRPLWLLAGGVLFFWGAPWGVMAMLAGAAQRRYITWSSRNTRADVAHRLRAILMRHRPSGDHPLPVYLRDRCVEPKCRAEVPRGINYCPRCGTRQKAQVNRVV
jgi:hypothetical protein